MSGVYRGTSRYVATSAYDAAILADAPIAYLPMSAGGATDLTGNGHSGTLHGSPGSTTFANGESTLVFDGSTSQYVEIPDHSAFSVPTTGILAVEAWLRPDVLDFTNAQGTGPYVYWAGKLGTHSESVEAEWACRMYNLTSYRPNRISGYVFNNTPLPGQTVNLGAGSFFQDTVIAGDWIHYCLVINTVNTSSAYTTGYTKVFKNGHLRDQDALSDYTITPQDSTAPIRIGTATLDSFLQGSVAKFAVYNYEPTIAQLKAHYELIYPSSASARFVAHIGHTTTTTSGTKLNLAITAPGVEAGSTVLVKVAHSYTLSSPTCVDSKGNVYTLDRTDKDASNIYRHGLFSAQINASLVAGDVIQVQAPATVAVMAMTADKYSGVTFSSPLDVLGHQSGTSTSPKLGTAIATTHGDDLITGVLTVNGPVTDTYTDDTGHDYTSRTRISASGAIDLTVNSADQAVTATASYNYQPVIGTSRSWLMTLAAYKGGTPTITPPPVGTAEYIDQVGTASSQSSGTTLVVTVGGDGVPADHTCILQISADYTSSAPTVVDSKSNTWTVDRTGADTGHTIRANLASSRVTTPLANGDTVTITWGSAITNKAATLEEFAAVAVPTVTDGVNGAAGTSVAPTVATTTTHANDLLFATVAVLGPTADAFSADVVHQWTAVARFGTNSGSGDHTLNGGWRAAGATGTFTMAPDLGTSRTWVALIAAYQAT